MPPYPPSFAALWTALRDGVGLAGAVDESEANRGLVDGYWSVMGYDSVGVGFQFNLIDRSICMVAPVYHEPKLAVNPLPGKFSNAPWARPTSAATLGLIPGQEAGVHKQFRPERQSALPTSAAGTPTYSPRYATDGRVDRLPERLITRSIEMNPPLGSITVHLQCTIMHSWIRAPLP
jgi:hypothetical protein